LRHGTEQQQKQLPAVKRASIVAGNPPPVGANRRHSHHGYQDPHVQQRIPGAIFRLEALELSTGPCNASANCGNVEEECPWRP
jgi:hypothetical protein